MDRQRTFSCSFAIAALATWFSLCAPAAASAQDVLSRAKDLYASAAYEDALQLLDTVKDKPMATEAAAYQVFCLVALGRRDDARAATEALVRADPLFRPSESQVSPRIRAFFDDVRKPLLPEIARQTYAKGKAAFDQKAWAQALGDFDRAIALLREVDATDASVADVRTLTAGFRDLALVALQPPPAPTPAPAAPAEPVVYGVENTDVRPPVALSKPLPIWRPTQIEQRMKFSGVIELVIGEDGKVLFASLVDSVYPPYDGPLLAAAKHWTFRPAIKNGLPVKYRYTIAIELGR